MESARVSPSSDVPSEEDAMQAVVALIKQFDGWMQALVAILSVLAVLNLFRSRVRAALDAIARLFSLRVTSRQTSSIATSSHAPANERHTVAATIVLSRRPSLNTANSPRLPNLVKESKSEASATNIQGVESLPTAAAFQHIDVSVDNAWSRSPSGRLRRRGQTPPPQGLCVSV